MGGETWKSSKTHAKLLTTTIRAVVKIGARGAIVIKPIKLFSTISVFAIKEDNMEIIKPAVQFSLTDCTYFFCPSDCTAECDNYSCSCHHDYCTCDAAYSRPSCSCDDYEPSCPGCDCDRWD